MKNYRTAGIILSVLFMLLFLGALGLRIWASGKSAETIGPDHIAVAQERVYVHVNGELFVLSATGKIEARKEIEPLIHDTSLIDMRVLRDGRLLLARQQPAGIDVCDTRHWRCEPLGRAVTAKINGQFKVLVDEPSETLYVTDSGSFRVWTKALSDGEPQLLTEEKIFFRPNDIAMDADGRLWIADSGHRRIVALERDNDGAWKEARSHGAANKLASDQRDWPMMLAMAPDGNWWVTQPTPTGGNGDLLVYHPEQGVRARVELPEGAYPTDLANLGPDMLVTDMDRFKIYRIDATTHALSDFGDDAFQALMIEGSERKARYLTIVDYSLIGMIAFGALMIAAAFWASPREKRWTPAPAGVTLGASNTPAPSLKELYWLRRHPKAERQLRWMKLAMYLSPVFFAVTIGLAYFVLLGSPEASDMTPERLEKTRQLAEEFERLFVMSVFFIGGTTILTLTAMRNLMHRLGTDGHRLFVKLASGKQIVLAPEQLVYTAKAIACKDYVFAVQTGHGLSLYEDDEINTYIAPLLARARKLGAWKMFRYQLEHREPTLMTSIILMIMLTAMMFATGLWRHILPGL